MSNNLDQQTLFASEESKSEILEKLFRDVNPYLLRVCIANKFFNDEAEDLVHQTWEKFFENLDKFEGRSQIRTFVCGILFNKIREHRRMQKRFVSEEDTNFVDRAFASEGWWNVEPTDPHRLFHLKQASGFVKECLEGLTEQQMAAFIMREVEEESSQDICNVLEVELSHLRVILFRAKEKLKSCLEGKVAAEHA